MMHRIFVPVGQGAFYLEKFEIGEEKFNIVYDCGTSTETVDIKTKIKSYFEEDEEIDYVFISHLHKDHISGLDFLLKHCNVKNVVFPFSEKEKYVCAIEYLCSSPNHQKSDFVYNMINDPFVTINNIVENNNKQIKITGIEYYDEKYDEYTLNLIREEKYRDENYREEKHIDENNNEEHDIIRIVGDNGVIIKSGHRFHINITQDTIDKSVSYNESNISPKIYWEYVPYNFQNQKRKKKFYKLLTNIFREEIDDNNISDIINNWEDKETKVGLMNAYKELGKDLNLNSMVLFSGSYDNHITQTLCKHNNFCACNKSNGCLYLGDYKATGKNRWNDLDRCYRNYKEMIGCIQLPHHGSSKSYNNKLASFDAFFIASAGKNNKYEHPNESVIKNLLFNNKPLFLVSEEEFSEIDFNVF